jgi:ligand-binding SRPBCC domain-containing protein
LNEKEIEFVQWIPASLDEVFAFFSAASNLEKLTPPWLHFKIIGQSTPQIQKGTLIDYQLKLRGLPFKWKTLIEEWNPQHSFVDTQLKGPYKLWHHTHIFEAKDGGVLVTDRIRYEVPMGLIGDLVAGNYVKKDVTKIFNYRKKIISEIFPEKN